MTVVRSGAATDVGRVRAVNQDVALETPNLFAVADGMGGHAGGEVAARVAVDALASAFASQASVEGLGRAVGAANAAVWSQGQARTDLRGMGTTLTAAALVSGSDGRDVIALANVGDSRAYLYTAGRLTRLTVDHSLAEEKVRYGELTEAEAAVHPHRHILTRALGVGADVDVDLWELHLRTGDRLLLCSDGLTNEVSEERIAGVLESVPEPATVARDLVRAANDNGGNDNITVLLVDVLVGDDDVATEDIVSPRSGSGIPPVVVATSAGAVARDVTTATPAVVTAEAARSSASQLDASPGDGTRAGPSTSAPVPVAASSTAVAPPSRPVDDRATTGDARRVHRRRVPRRITLRVVVFAILVVGVLVAAYFVVRWYATDNWYVTVDNGELVVYQGRPGGLLWFDPVLVDRTGVQTTEVLPIHLAQLRGDVDRPSLAAARRYVHDLRQEFVAQQRIASGSSVAPPSSGAVTTTTTAPAGVTTAPPGAALGVGG